MSALGSLTTGLFPPSSSLSSSSSVLPSGGYHRPTSSLVGVNVGSSGGAKHKLLKSTPVVIDIGDAYIKAGFAGETYPRHVLHTRTMIEAARAATAHDEPSDETHTLSPAQLRVAATELSTSRAFVSNPYHTSEGWRRLLASLLRSIYFQHLHVNPRDRRVLLIAGVAWTHAFTRAALHALWEMDVPAVCVKPAMECVLYSSMPSVTHPLASSGTALIIDVGWSETRVLPVYLGYPLAHLLRCVPLGMYDVVRRFRMLARPHLRMEYAQEGGDTDSAFYHAEEARVLSTDSIERTLALMAYVQPFQVALDAYKTELRGQGVELDAPPLPHTPASNAAADLPPPLPFSFALHPPPPPVSDARASTPGLSVAALAAITAPAVAPAHMPLPAAVLLPELVRGAVFETLFAFDRSAAAHATTERTQEQSTAPPNEHTSDAECGIPESVLSVLLDARMPSEVRAALLSNVLLLGGTCMTAGFAERFVDELNWLLGGGVTLDASARVRARQIEERGLHKLQHRLVLNPCSSAVSARPAPTAPGAPPAPTPFAANALAWVGASVLGSLEACEEAFVPHAELRAYIRGREVPAADIDTRRRDAEQRHARERTKGEGAAKTMTQPPKEDADDDSASTGTVLLRPFTFPDWSHDGPRPKPAAPIAAATSGHTYSISSAASVGIGHQRTHTLGTARALAQAALQAHQP